MHDALRPLESKPAARPSGSTIAGPVTWRERLIGALVRKSAGWAKLALAEDVSGALVMTPAFKEPPPTASDEAAQNEAREKFERWKDVDPFPKIAPALLNAADIDDYMRAAAMVFPYDPSKRKTASYALSVGTEIAYWDPDEPNQAPIRELKSGSPVTIPPNSLVYVRTAQDFQLPNYMAVRFNLHIDLVHKGLLLGTGPLVDPGFFGKLMVPLHNLTSNTYVLAVGDDFIWAEFTKTSLATRWLGGGVDRPEQSGELVAFPPRKENRTLAYYLHKARLGHERLQPGVSHYALQNAIPDAIYKARKTAQDAKASANKAKRRLTETRNLVAGLGLLALIGAAATLNSQIQASRSALQSTLGLVKDTNKNVGEQDARLRVLEAEVARLRAERQRNPVDGGKEAPHRRGS